VLQAEGFSPLQMCKRSDVGQYVLFPNRIFTEEARREVLYVLLAARTSKTQEQDGEMIVSLLNEKVDKNKLTVHSNNSTHSTNVD
jgi:hypothetical protein